MITAATSDKPRFIALFTATIPILYINSSIEGSQPLDIISEILFPAFLSLSKLATARHLYFGRGRIPIVASTTTPSVPSEPTINLSS